MFHMLLTYMVPLLPSLTLHGLLTSHRCVVYWTCAKGATDSIFSSLCRKAIPLIEPGKFKNYVVSRNIRIARGNEKLLLECHTSLSHTPTTIKSGVPVFDKGQPLDYVGTSKFGSNPKTGPTRPMDYSNKTTR